ncbi:NADPH oxidase organizer 1-like isoform X2 [Rhinatrema bivittatum]|nr:NADPH oxidase organizer 1-like isoform X2 [Rhinatrema bivittatum]
MLSVLWSDHNNILIYRTFEEFKKLDRDLRRRFPLEAGFLRKSERIIPKLKDAPVFLRHRKSTHQLLERLQLLETYSQELLCTDPKISQAQEVTQFFTPQTRDLDPSFPQDSIVIMPSEAGEGKRASLTPESHTPVTQPIVSQRYVCMGAYETKDTKNRPFRVKQDERLEVLIRDATGWWLVENWDGQLAWFPAPYLMQDNVKEEDRAEDPADGALYCVVRGYEARNSDEVSVTVGVILEALEKSDTGWWLVCYNGKAGYIPSMYLRPYRNPYEKFQVMVSRGRYGSTPNLQKATSSFEVNMLSQRRKSEGDPPQRSGGPSLERMRLTSLSRHELRSPLPLELQSLSVTAENMDMGCSHSPLRRTDGNLTSVGLGHIHKHEEGDLEPLSDSGISGFDEASSMSGSDLSLSSSDSDSNPTPPKIPPRPKAHEILQTCSTVTKRAVQRALAEPGLLAPPVLRQPGTV